MFAVRGFSAFAPARTDRDPGPGTHGSRGLRADWGRRLRRVQQRSATV